MTTEYWSIKSSSVLLDDPLQSATSRKNSVALLLQMALLINVVEQVDEKRPACKSKTNYCQLSFNC